tara:strand:+ start:2699 stop:3061 length:363 start_codon:yes stop_codon:yes gene_type:complete
MLAYQVTGLTHKVTATAVSSETNITPTEAGVNFSGQGGPIYFKITNGSSSENVYFQTGTTSQTATIPTGDGASAGSCVIPAYAEVIVQVASTSAAPQTIYIACIAAASSPVFITPVTLIA